MKYAEKYGFTPEQAKALKEQMVKDGTYDGRFEDDFEETVESIENEVSGKVEVGAVSEDDSHKKKKAKKK